VSPELRAFSVRHAFCMLAGLALAFATASGAPLALAALASFAYWLWQERAAFSASGGFGAANSITSVRVLSLFLLAFALDARLQLAAALVGLSIFSLDGLDGFIARRTRHETSLGAFYDSEADASFTLLLTWGVYQQAVAGVWVLLGGLLRYAYVLSLYFARIEGAEAPRTRLGRYVFGLSVSGYMLSLWPFASVGGLFSGAATGLLLYSFSRSFRASFAGAARPA